MPIRPIGREYLPDMTRLVRPAFEELHLDEHHLDMNLFEDPDFEPDLCLGYFEEGDLAAVAMAVPRRGPDDSRADDADPEPVGHLKILHARSRSRSNAILSELLDEIEPALRRRGSTRVQTGGAAPVYLLPGLPRRSHATRALLEAAGYRCVEKRRSMTVHLSSADLDTESEEERLGRRGIVFRCGEEYDRVVIPAQVRSAFSGDWAFEVDRALGARSPRGDETSPVLEDTSRILAGRHVHLALSDGQLAGFAVAGLWAVNAFGPMGTLRDFEGQGVGAVLLRRALRDLRTGGVSTGLIPWIGPEEFYRRVVGAETTLEYELLEKSLERT